MPLKVDKHGLWNPNSYIKNVYFGFKDRVIEELQLGFIKQIVFALNLHSAAYKLAQTID